MPAMPPWIAIAAPEIPARSACDWLDGIPKYHEIPDHKTIPISAVASAVIFCDISFPKLTILKTAEALPQLWGALHAISHIFFLLNYHLSIRWYGGG